MIYHISMPADDPERVARVIAELWRGTYHPFIAPRTYIVLANDGRGTEMEIRPRGMELIPGATEVDFKLNPEASPYNQVHVNMQIVLTYAEALAIARREGWTARICDRGGFFELVEFWVENKFMLELMSAEEVSRYQRIMNPEFWRNRPPPTGAP